MSAPAKNRSELKLTGAHYTPPALARFVAEQICRVAKPFTDDPLRILDPAVGDGELLGALLEALPSEINTVVTGFDTDIAAIKEAHERLAVPHAGAKLSLNVQDFLERVSGYAHEGEGLFASAQEHFDLIIANPPYVRTQVMGANESRRLAKAFGLSGRVDLYHAFLEAIALALREGGIAGIICSNRFMTTRSGLSIRKRLADHFEILEVWDLGDTKLFEAAVLPAVLLLRKRRRTSARTSALFTSIYTAEGDTQERADTPLDALGREGLIRVNGEVFQVRRGQLDYSSAPEDVWRLSNAFTDKWLQTVADHTHCIFGEIGKIRVGVKTTADRVFIGSHWELMPATDRPELLKPLITRHSIKRFSPVRQSPETMILYTHEICQGRRTTVDLDKFPRSKKYLEKFRGDLEARSYLSDAGREWFEIWVPQNPEAWKLPKLVFPDIAVEPTFCLDFDGSVVNGDCYWLAATNESELGLLWLALAVGNSSFVESFYDHRFHNKLYSGRRRFMTQYVEEFPLPDPAAAVGLELIRLSKEIYAESKTGIGAAQSKLEEMNALVWSSFGLPIEKIRREPNLQLAI